jgi:hypothetical protein
MTTMSRVRHSRVALLATGLYGFLMLLSGQLERHSYAWSVIIYVLAGICFTIVVHYIWRSTLPPSSPSA